MSVSAAIPSVSVIMATRGRPENLAQLHEVHPALGPFDPAVFTEDLPAPLAAVVRHVGSSRMALGVARALLAGAGALRLAGWASGRVRLAKLARWIMLVWGATAGEGGAPFIAGTTAAAVVVTLEGSGPLTGLDQQRGPTEETLGRYAVG